jgi:hypothetical protein
MYISSRWIFLASFLCSIAGSSSALAQQKEMGIGTSPAQARASFEKFYDLVSSRNSGKVHVAVMIDAMCAQEDPKTLQRIQAWDGNGDGVISRAEGGEGMLKDLSRSVDDQMSGDTNGDAILSQGEYALAVPDPNGAKQASGLTKRQEIMFESGDVNKDQRYSREEAKAAMSYRLYHGYIGRTQALRARVFDADQNRKYEETEFGMVFGIPSGTALPTEIAEKFRGKAFGAGNHNYYNMMMRIIHLPLPELRNLEKRIDEFSQGDSASAPSGAARGNLR